MEGMSALVATEESQSSGPDVEGSLERTESEQECDLMIDALRRELDGIKVRCEI